MQLNTFIFLMFLSVNIFSFSNRNSASTVLFENNRSINDSCAILSVNTPIDTMVNDTFEIEVTLISYTKNFNEALIKSHAEVTFLDSLSMDIFTVLKTQYSLIDSTTDTIHSTIGLPSIIVDYNAFDSTVKLVPTTTYSIVDTPDNFVQLSTDDSIALYFNEVTFRVDTVKLIDIIMDSTDEIGKIVLNLGKGFGNDSIQYDSLKTTSMWTDFTEFTHITNIKAFKGSDGYNYIQFLIYNSEVGISHTHYSTKHNIILQNDLLKGTGTIQFDLYDLKGRRYCLFKGDIKGSAKLNFSKISSGVYLMKLTNLNDGTVTKGKLEITK